VLVGEMRDLETDPGGRSPSGDRYLAFATLHTNSGWRDQPIIDVFPSHQQAQVSPSCRSCWRRHHPDAAAERPRARAALWVRDPHHDARGPGPH